MGLAAILEIVNVFCLATKIIDWPNPLCTYGTDDSMSIETDDPSQALKNRLETMPDNLGIVIPDGPIGQLQAEGIMSTAISAMKSQATVGPDAMSQDELAEYLARLAAPEPTTMLTVAASLPTKRAEPEVLSESEHSSEQELKKTAGEVQRAGIFCIPTPFWPICL
ncbi:unnamed protein product [Aureobasidium mustum]|uniref:Uncharacterized protein n=1 Tax=Aureobasidium mustum TaxID=2773714 RepID=A0A9N8PH49_9PEZI|nr:unnamed protein product [Aureobasidium mustum]